MSSDEKLLGFLEKILNDPIIDTKHIALYVILYRRWILNGCSGPIIIKSKIIMGEAKISSTATYFKKINELKELNYIRYFPNYNPSKGTFVDFLVNDILG